MPSADNDAVRFALECDRTVDVTTIGRKSGRPRRIEIWFHYLDGRVYISGLPGPRGWYANLLARPEFTFHLKQSVSADLPALARPVTEPEERRSVLKRVLARLGRESAFDEWFAASPIVEVQLLALGFSPPEPSG